VTFKRFVLICKVLSFCIETLRNVGIMGISAYHIFFITKNSEQIVLFVSPTNVGKCQLLYNFVTLLRLIVIKGKIMVE
jgi:hypothetical protein